MADRGEEPRTPREEPDPASAPDRGRALRVSRLWHGSAFRVAAIALAWLVSISALHAYTRPGRSGVRIGISRVAKTFGEDTDKPFQALKEVSVDIDAGSPCCAHALSIALLPSRR